MSERESKPRRSRAGDLAREVRAVDPGSWTSEAIRAALHDWSRVVGRAPRAHEWSSVATGPSARASRWQVEHPRWPSAGAVVHHFGSWSDGLRAAGLPTLYVEHELPLGERVATALALRAAGEPVRSIADQLGVDLRTAYRYLRRRHLSRLRRPRPLRRALPRPRPARPSHRHPRRDQPPPCRTGRPSTARRRASWRSTAPRSAGSRGCWRASPMAAD